MKIAVPAETPNLNNPVCPSFGRTPYFVLYDTDNGKYDFLDNSAAASQGGAGIKTAQMLVDLDAKVLITHRCGENAAEVLNSADIEIFKARAGTIQDNITGYNDGKLSVLIDIHPGLNDHGGGQD